MKIIQITDTHLMPRGTDLYGLDPCKRLETCIESINEYHADADLCIITGDLTDQGDREAYLICAASLNNCQYLITS